MDGVTSFAMTAVFYVNARASCALCAVALATWVEVFETDGNGALSTLGVSARAVARQAKHLHRRRNKRGNQGDGGPRAGKGEAVRAATWVLSLYGTT